MSYEATAAELETFQNIRHIYNSGHCDQALEMAVQFLASNPNSLYARYAYVVMHGDYSSSPIHSPQEKQRLLSIAKDGISKLFHDPDQIY